jgi:hypothetical protein
MKVARQFTAWDVAKDDPSRRVRYDGIYSQGMPSDKVFKKTGDIRTSAGV